MPHMRAYRVVADAAFVGDQLVAHSFGQACQDFLFAGAEVDIVGLLLHKLVLEHTHYFGCYGR